MLQVAWSDAGPSSRSPRKASIKVLPSRSRHRERRQRSRSPTYLDINAKLPIVRIRDQAADGHRCGNVIAIAICEPPLKLAA